MFNNTSRRFSRAKHLYLHDRHGPASCVASDSVKIICNLNPTEKKTRQKKDVILLQRSQENYLKREKDFAERELRSMLPFKKSDSDVCGPLKIRESDPSKYFTMFLIIQLIYQIKHSVFLDKDSESGFNLRDFRKLCPNSHHLSNAFPNLVGETHIH